MASRFYNLSTDNTLGGVSPSDAVVSSQKAIKDYVDNHSSGGQFKANTNLDNLTEDGKNISIWSSNVTNCITEISQDIKLELNNGTLTLKSGSKVYVPNGVGVFDEVVTTSDVTIGNTWGSQVQLFVYVKSDGSQLWIQDKDRAESGSTEPTATNNRMWYDTTSNLIKRYAVGADTGDRYSFPIAVCTKADNVESANIASIDHVFNGFGYIGSTVFGLPGVKGLIPNGRNTDGTLKNTEFNISSVLTRTFTTHNVSYGMLGINPSFSNYFGLTDDASYDEQNNRVLENGVEWAFCIIGCASASSGIITYFNIKSTFRAFDYNDLSLNSFILKPGFIIPYAALSVPSGWLVCDGSAISRTKYSDLFAVIGTSYGAGDGSTTFNVPDLSNRVPMRRQGVNVGNKEEGYLPNITGVIGQGDCSAGTYNATRSGAFYATNTSGKSYLYDRHATSNTIGDIGFSASRSSSVYSNVSGVYPRNLSVGYYLIKY